MTNQKTFIDMITNLQGRLRNTSLPKSRAMYSLFEALVNSINSVDERIIEDDTFSISDSKISITVLRDPTYDGSKGELIGFEISDNGVGFDTKNFKSFNTLDSDLKASKGCHGIGRLLWLKVFSNVVIESTYKEDDRYYNRKFKFNSSGIYEHELSEVQSTIQLTTIRIQHISRHYSDAFPAKATTVSKMLLEHCMWYFMREGSAPNIYIIDDDEIISLNKEYDNFMLEGSYTESISIKGTTFDLTHIKSKHSKESQHYLNYCAADRIVIDIKLDGKIPGLYDAIIDDSKEKFYYSCYVTSEYLTDNVNDTRQDFTFAKTNNGLYSKEDISLEDINNAVLDRIKAYLLPYLSQKIEEGKKHVEKFIAEKAPRYKSILKRIPDEALALNPKITDKELELKLHSYLHDVESELIAEGHDLMKPVDEDSQEEYVNRISEYLSKANDLKQSDLANYVMHRKVIIDLFANALKLQDSGKYSREEIIHKLIMPMRVDSTEVLSEENNLWLIDERLAFHHYLASDKTLKSMPITDSESTKEPDLFALNIYDNPLLVNEGESLPLASLTVIEIKRPMRNDIKAGEDKDPIEQALDYIEKIREGSVKTASGRIIPNASNIPGFCYILCDLTPSLVKRVGKYDLKLTSDKMGYFGYNSNYHTYIEVISFDRLLNNAKQRNRAFFDKLGLPAN